MPTQVGGNAIVWGINTTNTITYGTTDPTTNSLSGKVYVTEYAYQQSSDIEDTRNEVGEVVGHCVYNLNETLTVSLFPYAATLAAAKTNNNLPDVGSVVKIVGATDDDTDITAAATGKVWLLTEASKNRTASGRTTWNWTLKRNAGVSSYVQIAT